MIGLQEEKAITMLIQTIQTASPGQVRPVAKQTLQVRVYACRNEAQGILSLELRPVDSVALPPFSAGAHIEIDLPDGLSRSYSLVNSQLETHRYVVAVNLDKASRGGSAFIHDRLRVGDVVSISAPRNHFPLNEDASLSVMFAGGIGITPLFSMAQRLDALKRHWEMHYFARSRACAAFVDSLVQLAAQGRGSVHCHFDDETDSRADLAKCVASVPTHAHLYCCGPAPMLDAFVDASSGRPPSQVHLERFSAAAPVAAEGGFSVVLSRSGRTIQVVAGQTILDAVLKHGIEAPHACKEGVCGSCETRVLDGKPEHRDTVLGLSERASNRTMMICCSGCKSGTLVLDL
jgi:tetrachlorobenzoquinone reductase